MLGQEGVGVVGLHRSAVEDPDAGRGLGAELGDEQRADESVDFLSHGRGRGLAGADRPDGLVGDAARNEWIKRHPEKFKKLYGSVPPLVDLSANATKEQ